MTRQQDVDYTVILVFPGFGTERECAESVIENALEWLNTNKDEPGFRFAYPVSAHLETVLDLDAAHDRIDADELVATIILHDVDEDECKEFARECDARDIAVGCTIDAPRPTGKSDAPWELVIRPKGSSPEAPLHRVCAETLTAPVGDDDDTGKRIGEMIAVLALGVMEHHWRKHPPKYLASIQTELEPPRQPPA